MSNASRVLFRAGELGMKDSYEKNSLSAVRITLDGTGSTFNGFPELCSG